MTALLKNGPCAGGIDKSNILACSQPSSQPSPSLFADFCSWTLLPASHLSLTHPPYHRALQHDDGSYALPDGRLSSSAASLATISKSLTGGSGLLPPSPLRVGAEAL